MVYRLTEKYAEILLIVYGSNVLEIHHIHSHSTIIQNCTITLFLMEN